MPTLKNSQRHSRRIYKMSKSREVVVKVENLTKTFKIPTEASNGIKQKLINIIKGKRGYRKFTVLDNISFEINKGDFFGIVGRNGSGKSTLLKSIANIYNPTGGSVNVSGTLVPFIELGVGFNPELTGRENVFLNGALLGFSHKQMEVMYDEIVDFAEISDFMDEKLKNYSSGMQVRLAFSIAIKAEGDILLLDEVLAVGDEAFQRKCYAYFAELKRNKKTVILVTHSMDAVQQFCTKAMMIESGKIVSMGNTLEVSHKYQELFVGKDIRQLSSGGDSSNKLISCKTDFNNLGKEIEIKVRVTSKKDLNDTVLTLGINKEDGEQVYRWISDDSLGRTVNLKKGDQYELTVKLQNIFPVGTFSIGVRVKNHDRTQNYAIFDEIKRFEIENRNTYVWDTLWVPIQDVKFEKI